MISSAEKTKGKRKYVIFLVFAIGILFLGIILNAQNSFPTESMHGLNK